MTEPNAAGAAVSAPEDVYTDKKRALFDKLYAFLNPKQREAVYAVNGPLLVLAGAGSGKTTVLVNRIAHLIHFGNAYEDAFVPAGAEKYVPAMDALLESGTKEELTEFLRATAGLARASVEHPLHHLHQQGCGRVQAAPRDDARPRRPRTLGRHLPFDRRAHSAARISITSATTTPLPSMIRTTPSALSHRS